MSDIYPGLGKKWVDAPGFMRWLSEVRPVEMHKGDKDGGGEGGRNSWASESEIRAMYRAEKESKTLRLDIADAICVKLDIHIDSELPDELWCEQTKRGPDKRKRAYVGLVPHPTEPKVLVRA